MEELNVDELIAKIKDKDDKVRAAAWLSAGKYGAAAVEPLAKVMTDEDMEVARAAKRGLWKIVRHAGRPGANDDRTAVVDALCELLWYDQPAAICREVLWMLSEIGGDEAIDAIRGMPGILEDTEIREDARCTIERIPSEFAVQTLQEGLEVAPDDFKLNMAQSLRARGVDVPGLPCQKLVPTKQTKAKPAGR